jgi:hypothetical protein
MSEAERIPASLTVNSQVCTMTVEPRNDIA